MALRSLSNGEMLLLTRLAFEDLKPAFEAEPAYAQILRVFGGLLPELTALQPTAARAHDPSLAEEGRRLDAEHDRLLRGLFHLLSALAELEPERTGDFQRLQSHLFPEGLRGVTRTYADQAADTRRVDGRIDEFDKTLLDAIPLPGGRTATDVFDAWVASGAALERFERRRIAADTADGVSGVRLNDVRNRWIRTVHALEGLVNVMGRGAHPWLDAVRSVERRADGRAGEAGADTVPAPRPV
jgi:hypothetical protein